MINYQITVGKVNFLLGCLIPQRERSPTLSSAFSRVNRASEAYSSGADASTTVELTLSIEILLYELSSESDRNRRIGRYEAASLVSELHAVVDLLAQSIRYSGEQYAATFEGLINSKLAHASMDIEKLDCSVVASIVAAIEVDPSDIAELANAINRVHLGVGGRPLDIRDGGSGRFVRTGVLA